jgi:hypothetical protein
LIVSRVCPTEARTSGRVAHCVMVVVLVGSGENERERAALGRRNVERKSVCRGRRRS